MKYFPRERTEPIHIGYQQQVKEANIKRIFDLVRSGRCKSRAEIVRCMDLSATSVSVLVEELAKRRLIDETGPAQTLQPGRRPINLRLNKSAHQAAVFSIGPAGVNFALMNLECRILEREFFPLDSGTLTDVIAGEEYTRLFDEILRTRSKRFSPSRAVVIGVTFPGTYVERDHIFFTRPRLGVSLTEESIRHFQQRIGLPVFLTNETRSMAYAEKKYRDAADSEGGEIRDMLFVKINEGISGAAISGGTIYTGPHNTSCEIGHFTLDYRGLPCPCGSRGCLERYVNLNRILADAREAAEAAGTEPPVSLEDLAKRYPDEPALLASVKRSAGLLAFGLYNTLCGSGMRKIVLGGGIEILGKVFLEEVYHILMSRSMMVRRLDLSYAQASSDAVLLGVAEFFLDKVFTITM